MATAKQEMENAIATYGPSVSHIAQQYGVSGEALLAKLVQGESGSWADPVAGKDKVSSAGAKAWGQFMPGSRREAISKYGIDPWRSITESIHATALHLRGKINGKTGLEGYNPGDPTYKDYVLKQRVGDVRKTLGRTGAADVNPTAAGLPSGTVSGAAPTSTPATATGMGFDAGDASTQSAGSIKAALEARLQQAPQPVIGGLAAPAHSAGPVMPAGYQAPASMGGPQAPPTIQLPDPTIATLPEVTVTPGVTSGPAGTSGAPAAAGGTAAAAGKGKVKVSPQANRNGAQIQAPILEFVDALSASMGREVDVTTGTNHNKMTLSGNVSDHWAGNAVDLGMGGDARQDAAISKKGDLIAAHAIANASGLSFGKALAVARKGGIHNFDTKAGRVQVIWKTMEGGDHFNHVHIGLNPGR